MRLDDLQDQSPAHRKRTGQCCLRKLLATHLCTFAAEKGLDLERFGAVRKVVRITQLRTTDHTRPRGCAFIIIHLKHI